MEIKKNRCQEETENLEREERDAGGGGREHEVETAGDDETRRSF